MSDNWTKPVPRPTKHDLAQNLEPTIKRLDEMIRELKLEIEKIKEQ
jgi:hypothetical protein